MNEKKIFTENSMSFFIIILLVGALTTGLFFLAVQILNLLDVIKNYPSGAVAILLVIISAIAVLSFFMMGWLIPRLLAPKKEIKLKECESNE